MFLLGILTGWAILAVAVALAAIASWAAQKTQGTECLRRGCWLDIRAGSKHNIVVWLSGLRHDLITRRRKWHQQLK